MAKRKNEKSLKDVIDEMFTSYQLNPKINEAKVVNSWEKIMGKTIANYTRHISVKSGKLYLKIQSAPLKQELFYSREKIIDLLNTELGEDFIQDVVFF